LVVGCREHAPERGDEIVVGGKDRQVHLPADGLPLLLHLDVVVGGAARPAAERGAHRRPPYQLLLLLPVAVVEERQRLLERSLAAPARRVRRAAELEVRGRWRQSKLQLHVELIDPLPRLFDLVASGLVWRLDKIALEFSRSWGGE
jgi:hypothetical protein